MRLAIESKARLFTFSASRIPARSVARTSPRPPRRTIARRSHAVATALANPRSGRCPKGFGPGGSAARMIYEAMFLEIRRQRKTRTQHTDHDLREKNLRNIVQRLRTKFSLATKVCDAVRDWQRKREPKQISAKESVLGMLMLPRFGFWLPAPPRSLLLT